MRQQLTSGWRWAPLFLGLAMLVGLPGPARSQETPPQAVARSPELQEADRLSQRAVKLVNEGKYDDAIPLAERVLAIYAQVLGPEYLEVATTLAYLGFLYTKKGEYDRAELLYQRALALREQAFGPEHPDVATSLINLGGLYFLKGDYSRVESLFQRALAIHEKALGPEHPTVAVTLEELAALYFSKHDYNQAEPLWQRALAIREKVLGPEHLEVVVSVRYLAILYTVKGDHSRAEALWQRALAIREKALGPEHLEVAESLDRLAGFYRIKHDYDRAEPLYQRALAIREKALGPEHLEVAKSLHSFALLYSMKLDYSGAEPLWQRDLAIREKILGPEHPNVADTLSRLAALYNSKGDYSRAESLYQRALAILEKALGPEHPEVATTLNSLSELFTERADYDRAELFYQRALMINEKVFGPEDPKVATLLDRFAALYMAKTDYGRAEPLYQRALAIREKMQRWPESPYDIATSLNSLAALYMAKTDYGRAEPLYQRALAIREKMLGLEHPDVAFTLTHLAALYNDKGDYNRAEPLYQRVLAIYEKALGPEHPIIATNLNNLAVLYENKGDYSRAESLYQRALAIREKVPGFERPYVTTLSNLAVLYWTKGDLVRAVAFRARSEDISEHSLSLILATGSEDQKRVYLAPLITSTHGTVSLHTQAAPHDPQALRLALTTVLRRKGRVLDAMTDNMTTLRRRLRPEEQTLLEQLASARAQLATLVLRGPDKLELQQYHMQVAQREVQAQKLEAQLSARSAEFRIQSQPVTIGQLQQAIPPGAALVELVLYTPFHPQAQKPPQAWSAPARYVAYVLRQKGEPAWIDLGEAASIDREVAKLRTALSNPGRADVQQLARALDERVMRPIRPLLGNASLILLSPDGALNLVPFGALVDEEQRYLVERFTFVYLTTGRDLLRLQVQSPERQGSMVIANPDFDGGVTLPPVQLATAADRADSRRSVDFTNMRFRPLPGTAEEAVGLTNLLSKSQVLTGAAATEAVLKQVHGPHILHIATHGFFLADQPREPERTRAAIVSNESSDIPLRPSSLWVENPLLRSGLALAGANQRQSGAEDGVLTALEAAGLDLWGTKLVVLSACETGVGAVQNGEGVYGLRRALVMAGAESQVMSLWKVADEATRDLMIAYYQRLLSGEGRAEALRQVQLAMLASEERQHPFYWAGFIPSGQWGPIGGAAK